MCEPTLNQTGEEGLASEVGIYEQSGLIGNWYNGSRGRTVLLEVLLAGGDELDGGKLEAISTC